MNEIVYKVGGDFPEINTFEIAKFKPPREGEKLVFDLNVAAEAVEGQIKRAQVRPNLATWSNFSITCDEGTAFLGTDSAPAPLCYFSCGIAFCLLSHVSEFIRIYDLAITSAKVELRQRFESTPDDPEAWKNEGLESRCLLLEMHLILEGDEPEDILKKLHRTCIQGCIATQAVVQPTPLEDHLHVNGIEIVTD